VGEKFRSEKSEVRIWQREFSFRFYLLPSIFCYWYGALVIWNLAVILAK